MSATQTFFGDTFFDKEGNEYSASVLEHQKLIGLYFCAQWCPPCKNFTPVLKEFYDEIKSKAPQDLEIVYLSFDQTLEQYDAYKQEMPWKMIPYNDPRVKQFASQLGVNNIPSLLILRPDGTLLTKDARTDVTIQGPKACGQWKSINK